MKEIKDIYNMTKEENIFCAKRVLVDSIYKQANLEGNRSDLCRDTGYS